VSESTPLGQSASPIYVGETRRCDRCGEPTFFNYAMSSWGGGEAPSHTHGPLPNSCEKAAEAAREAPRTLGVCIQAHVQIADLLGRLICQTDDDEWNDVATLQRAVTDAYFLAGEGIRCETILREHDDAQRGQSA
jgi:hypothetical protein